MRTGVWLYPDESANALVDAILHLEELGVDEVWIADEGVAREPFSILAAAARETSRITLAVGITSPLLRHPGAVASTAMTVDELSGGRVVLGWGVGGAESLGPFGLSTDRPVEVLRRALRISQAVMNSESCGDYEPPPHAAPRRRIPQYIGARGPQLNRLASRAADGVFLSGLTTEELPRVIADARSSRPVSIALYQSVTFTGPAQERALHGTPDVVLNSLREMTVAHQPNSIGIALIDRRPLAEMISQAVPILLALH